MLLALLLAQALQPASPEGPIISSPEESMPTLTWTAVGLGWPVASDLCEYAAARGWLTGNAWCLRGDSAMQAGSGRTLTASGSPTTQTSTVCPSGPDCATKTAQRFATTARYSTGNVSNQPAGLTVCALAALDTIGAFSHLVDHYDGASSYTVSCYVDASGLFQCAFRNTTPTIQATGALAVTQAAVHLMCATYSTSDGIGRGYLDGTAGTPGTALSPATLNAASVPWNVGNSPAETTAFGGRIFGALVLEQQLTAPQVAALARAVLADTFTGAKGEAVTSTRSGAMFCPSSSGEGSIVPASRPCVSQGRLWTEPQHTNTALRWAELNNAAWVDSSDSAPRNPVLNAANAAFAPDGTLTAEDYTFIATTGAQYSARAQAGSCPTAPNTGSMWLKGVSGSGTTDVCGATVGCEACSYTSTSWTRCKGTNAGGSSNLYVGNMTNFNGGTARAENRVYVWGGQCESGTAASSGTPTTSASAITGEPSAPMTLTAAPALASCEATVATGAAFTATYPRAFELVADASNWLAVYPDTTNSNKLTCFYRIAGVSQIGTSAAGVPLSATSRVSCSYDGTSVFACIDGTCTATARSFTLFAGATTLYPGTYSSAGSALGPQAGVASVRCDKNARRFR